MASSAAPRSASCRSISAWISCNRASVIIPRPTADWLVTRTQAKPARRSLLIASAAPGRSRTMARIGEVVYVLDQRPVPVEEDGRAPLTLPAQRRFGEISSNCLGSSLKSITRHVHPSSSEFGGREIGLGLGCPQPREDGVDARGVRLVVLAAVRRPTTTGSGSRSRPGSRPGASSDIPTSHGQTSWPAPLRCSSSTIPWRRSG